jgi:hypothetical protein
MIGKKLLLGLAAATLAAGLAVPAMGAKAKCAPGKTGPKGCKNEIAACVAANCAELTKKAKAKCKRDCKRSVKLACRDSQGAYCASPSGAFVD